MQTLPEEVEDGMSRYRGKGFVRQVVIFAATLAIFLSAFAGGLIAMWAGSRELAIFYFAIQVITAVAAAAYLLLLSRKHT